MKKIIAIIGARPQFIKHFPFERAAHGKINLITVHTGQHYDANMSSVFFEQLKISEPQYILKNGGGNHGEQTGQMMIDIEKIILNESPDGIVVYGDTNSTLAGALVGVKLHVPIFHIEAGLRSYNMKMPEEVNRLLTDHVSTKLFVTSEIAKNNLSNEGLFSNIYLVGDLMKDLVLMVTKDNNIGLRKHLFTYYYATIHRPYNTDDSQRLLKIFSWFDSLPNKVVIALHPRTRKMLNNFGINIELYKNIVGIEPQGYIDNLNYMFHSEGVITDSGGIQKEAYWLKKKCVTIRTETEWVETITSGWNTLIFEEFAKISADIFEAPNEWDLNLYGDGFAANKIVDEIVRY